MEIHQSVFAALSKLPSLQDLHVRLPIASAVGSTPVYGMPFGVSPPMAFHSSHHHHHHHHTLHDPDYVPDESIVEGAGNNPSKKTTGDETLFAHFSGLRSLAVLEMDDLERVSEIAQCISSSYSTLKSLKLSFSDSLALKARKKFPSGTSDSDSASDEDDFGGPIPLVPQPAFVNTSPGSGPSATGPSTEADVRRERGDQESVLAQIFGLDESVSQQFPHIALDKAVAAASQEKLGTLGKVTWRSEDRLFVKELHQAAQELLTSGEKVPSKVLQAFLKLRNAATEYLEWADKSRSLKVSRISPPGHELVGKDADVRMICEHQIARSGNELLEGSILIVR